MFTDLNGPFKNGIGNGKKRKTTMNTTLTAASTLFSSVNQA